MYLGHKTLESNGYSTIFGEVQLIAISDWSNGCQSEMMSNKLASVWLNCSNSISGHFENITAIFHWIAIMICILIWLEWLAQNIYSWLIYCCMQSTTLGGKYILYIPVIVLWLLETVWIFAVQWSTLNAWSLKSWRKLCSYFILTILLGHKHSIWLIFKHDKSTQMRLHLKPHTQRLWIQGRCPRYFWRLWWWP